jgi:hypothetical protein
MEKNTACSVHYLIAAVVVGVVFDHRVMSVGGAKGNFNLTPGQCQVLETYHRFVDGFFVGLSPANKPKQAISKLVQLGNAISSTPTPWWFNIDGEKARGVL